jgi:hypothetical protein
MTMKIKRPKRLIGLSRKRILSLLLAILLKSLSLRLDSFIKSAHLIIAGTILCTKTSDLPLSSFPCLKQYPKILCIHLLKSNRFRLYILLTKHLAITLVVY